MTEEIKTLRDEFAISVVNALIIKYGLEVLNEPYGQHTVKTSYKVADDMLKERSK